MDDADSGGQRRGDLEGASETDETPTIRLDDVLKLAGVAATGGQAKQMIQAGEVRVNGAVETRRKHLLSEGDAVQVGDAEFVVELAGEQESGHDGGG